MVRIALGLSACLACLACGRTGFDDDEPFLVVQVVDESGEPVDAADFELREVDTLDPAALWNGRTNEDGAVVLPYPGRGVYEVHAWTSWLRHGRCVVAVEEIADSGPDELLVVEAEPVICG